MRQVYVTRIFKYPRSAAGLNKGGASSAKEKHDRLVYVRCKGILTLAPGTAVVINSISTLYGV